MDFRLDQRQRQRLRIGLGEIDDLNRELRLGNASAPHGFRTDGG
jgi:hypothetical protein